MKFPNKKELFSFLESTSNRATLTKGTAGSFLIQGGFAGLSFAIATLLARLLGSQGYGAYANAMAWVGIFGTIASFGFGSILVRDVAILRSQKQWADLKGFLRYSNRFVLFFSILLVLVILVIARVIYSAPDKEMMRSSLWVASLLIPLSALATLNQSTTRGLERVVHSLLPDLIIRPMLILMGILIIYYILPGDLNSLVAMGISVFAAAITLGLSSIWLKGFLPLEVNQAHPNYKIRVWMGAAFPMLVYGGLQIIISQTSTVLLGTQSSAEDVGLYAVAYRLSYLLTFFLGAVHIAMGPAMARLNAKGEKERLQRILTLIVRVTFLLTLLLSLVFLFASNHILAVFGPEFIAAKAALGILILGNLLDVASGSPTLLLVMTGHERSVAVIFAFISFINIVLNLWFISSYGFIGAALASVISLFLSRCIMVVYSVMTLQLNPTIFSFSKNGRSKNERP